LCARATRRSTTDGDTPQARASLVAGAADLIRRRGLNATSIRELAKHAGAPLGSTYHYFPGGKHQLASEAIQWAGAATASFIASALEKGDPLAGLRAYLKLWRKQLLDNDFRAGCPVMAVAVEEPSEVATGPQDAAAAAFRSWIVLLADALHAHGLPTAQARRHASLVVAAVEGAVAISRAQRSIDVFDDVAAELTRATGAMLI